MPIIDPFLLPADVLLIPVAELEPEVRKQFQSTDTDYAITRPRSRTPSKIVDVQTAELLTEFRSAKTIVDAVISYCEARQLTPHQTLEEAFPILAQFVNSQLLVPADSEEARRISQSFEAGERVSGWEVRRCVQVLEDTELYQVRNNSYEEAALKILRRDCGHRLKAALDREAAILEHLNGTVSPTLLDTGTFDGRRYLVTEWCAGVPVTAVAGELRRHATKNYRDELLGLCCAVLEAYAQLHSQEVIHSDVHPRNLLVDNGRTVKIIDFGLARAGTLRAKIGEPQRGGIGFFYEPEFAEARLGHRKPPRSSFLGEQYALAALLYLLVTGNHYLEFSAEKDEMLRQIAEENPLPFSRRAEPWPEVEAVLFRALRKDPSGRFPSVAEFATQLGTVAAAVSEASVSAAAQVAPFDQEAAAALLNEVIMQLAPDSPLFSLGLTQAPICSVNYGASGIACALYRIACVRDDAALLSLADLWASKSASNLADTRAFYNTEFEITPETVGRTALYHSSSGVYAVQALVGHAMGDVVSQQAGMDSFIAASKPFSDNLDITLGRSSTLMGCSLLLDMRPKMDYLNDNSLLEFGEEVFHDIWQQVSGYAPIREEENLRYLGIAHGWAGVLYASMRWCQTANRPLPAALEERLQQLAEMAEFRGRGARWKIRVRRSRPERPDDYMSGWCNGSAGHIFLWTLAHRLLRDNLYLELAEKAAWNAWEEPDNIDSLCCGLAGRAYGLLNLYKHTGEKQWLHRAEDLGNRALASTRTSDMRFSECLYKGRLGVVVLCADLTRPESSCMPLFEEEGWPPP
jgi:eukaryotic-like serine/threonine-protein kinase